MKQVLLESAGQLHSGLFSLINNPPDGYRISASQKVLPGSLGRRAENSSFRWTLEKFLPLNLAKPWIQTKLSKNRAMVDIIFGYNQVIFRKIPWITHVEVAHALVGRGFNHFERYKGIVRHKLASDLCKRILVWTEFARRSLLINFDSPTEFSHKISLVPQAVTKKMVKRLREDDRINLLFVGSTNAPDTFVSKGGLEVVKAFLILNKIHDRLTLTIRAQVPNWIVTEYKLNKFPNIRIIERAQTEAALHNEFLEADIFLYPTREAQNFVLLDALSFGLPVITTQIGSSGRLENEVNGIVLHEIPPRFGFLELRALGYNLPFDSFSISQILQDNQVFDKAFFYRTLKEYEERIVRELAEKTSILVDNPSLRLRIANIAKMEIDEGKFSIERRNRELKSVFDDAIKEAPGETFREIAA